MEIVVIADGARQNEFHDKGLPEQVQLQLLSSTDGMHENADAYFFLLNEDAFEKNKAALEKLNKIVFVHAITNTLNNLPKNCVRINAWPGFLLNSTLEIVSGEHNKTAVTKILEALHWKYYFIPDIVGMITPRTIAMIVNEAYFALADEVSSKEEMDIAMRLGTGYPYGPFEWSEKIGLKNIGNLLDKLYEKDKRYEPAALLKKEITL